MELYEAPLAMIAQLPATFGGVFVLRHSARYPILTDAEVYSAGLTPEGVQQAERLGAEIQKLRRPGRLLSSPVARCLDTAAALARGAGWEVAVQPDYRLSHPFIEPAWNALTSSGPPRTPLLPYGSSKLGERDERGERDATLTGVQGVLPSPIAGLLDLIVAGERAPGTLDLMVTHDTIVGTLAEYFTGVHISFPEVWPDFLEGVLLWQNAGELHLRWRDRERVIGPWPIPSFKQMELRF